MNKFLQIFNLRYQKYKELNKKQQIIIATVFGIILALVLAFSSVASYHYFKNKNTIENSNNNIERKSELPLVLDASQIEVEDKNTLNILLLGYGGAGHQGGMLSDIIQILHFDFPAQKISFISIPRDLEVTLGDGSRKKINSVFSYGGGEISKEVVAQLTGLNIKYFSAIDFVNFKRLIGQTLDGIEVQVSQTLEDPWYPIEGEQLNPCDYSAEEIAQMTNTLSGFALESKFACRYEHLYYEPGLHQMEGSDALSYVRSRHSSSDFDRSRRQVEVLTGVRKKLFDLDVLTKIPDFFKQINQLLQTDFDLETIEYLAPLLINADKFTINTINLSTQNVLTSAKNSNGFVLLPKTGAENWSEIQSFIQNSLAN